MIEAAEHQFSLDVPTAEGSSIRERLEGLETRTGRRPQDLDGPEPPGSLAYLLEWFADLNLDRQSTGFGPASITSGMILDWARGKGRQLNVREFDALRTLNRVWIKAWQEANPSQQPDK